MKSCHNTLRRQGGFTLVELMVVVAIIGVLAAIAVPQLTRYLRTAETAEPSSRMGDIASNVRGFIDSRANITPAALVEHLNGANLHAGCTADTCLNIKVPQIEAPATGHKWEYKVESITIDANTRIASFCLSAYPRDNDAVVKTRGGVFYSSTLVELPAWDGNFHRSSYTSASDATTIPTGGQCPTAAGGDGDGEGG